MRGVFLFLGTYSAGDVLTLGEHNAQAGNEFKLTTSNKIIRICTIVVIFQLGALFMQTRRSAPSKRGAARLSAAREAS